MLLVHDMPDGGQFAIDAVPDQCVRYVWTKYVDLGKGEPMKYLDEWLPDEIGQDGETWPELKMALCESESVSIDPVRFPPPQSWYDDATNPFETYDQPDYEI